MNENLIIVVCCIVLTAYCVGSHEFVPIKQYEGDVEDLEDVSPHDSDIRSGRVNSTVYQTVFKYNCSINSAIEGSHLMVYGTKGWTFPVQDVNLTLTYPTNENGTFYPTVQNGTYTEVEGRDYLLTGFRVVLYIDGRNSRGFVVGGGLMQDTITLSFVSSKISSLKYRFWLYGVRKDASSFLELSASYLLC